MTTFLLTMLVNHASSGDHTSLNTSCCGEITTRDAASSYWHNSTWAQIPLSLPTHRGDSQLRFQGATSSPKSRKLNICIPLIIRGLGAKKRLSRLPKGEGIGCRVGKLFPALASNVLNFASLFSGTAIASAARFLCLRFDYEPLHGKLESRPLAALSTLGMKWPVSP